MIMAGTAQTSSVADAARRNLLNLVTASPVGVSLDLCNPPLENIHFDTGTDLQRPVVLIELGAFRGIDRSATYDQRTQAIFGTTFDSAVEVIKGKRIVGYRAEQDDDARQNKGFQKHACTPIFLGNALIAAARH